ncbi:hypothetical protein F5878DRAFT_657936 [Lentinula raphanica]|uniref:Uncharacterized protein n=1 Tax=Lentinula raphanica TaxID=153919 RepID=A0AA38PG75_9AGAR|nr:hypothetical protein F5878DRAFT_657936 [Lentinula raphanica]
MTFFAVIGMISSVLALPLPGDENNIATSSSTGTSIQPQGFKAEVLDESKRPSWASVNRSSGPAVNQPSGLAVNRLSVPAVDGPSGPTVNRHPISALDRPRSPAVTRPSGPAANQRASGALAAETRPSGPAVNEPQSESAKTQNVLPQYTGSLPPVALAPSFLMTGGLKYWRLTHRVYDRIDVQAKDFGDY